MNTIRIEANAIPSKTVKYINYKTASTSMNCGLSFEDEEDLKQSIYLAVVKAIAAYDKSHGASMETFLHRSVDFATCEFLRNRRREKRVRLLYILDAPLEDGRQPDGCEGHETMLDETADKRDSGIHAVDLHHDVAEALRGLDRETSEVCRLLMEGESVREIARTLGIKRWVLMREIMPRIAARLEKVRDSVK